MLFVLMPFSHIFPMARATFWQSDAAEMPQARGNVIVTLCFHWLCPVPWSHRGAIPCNSMQFHAIPMMWAQDDPIDPEAREWRDTRRAMHGHDLVFIHE